jgi:hypothetical protein
MSLFERTPASSSRDIKNRQLKTMSQARKERRQKRLEKQRPPIDKRRWAIYAAVLVVVAGLAAYFVNRSQHKYDGFARCLASRGVKMYGAWWCPHCQDQKERFSKSFKYVPYVECGILGDVHGQSQACKDENVHHYPTWQFPPTGERVERVFSLEELSDRTGCALP